jgi:7-carboxy-7-deazaguanine synthase
VPESLLVNEIYLSLQGESTFAGLPCVFIRLTACNLRCSYCDTAYAFKEGRKMPAESVLAEVDRLAGAFEGDPAGLPHRLPLVELTGGEPLLQPGVFPLMKDLCDSGYTVLLETSGAHDISRVDPRVRRIMDLKCPSSGEVDRNLWTNIPRLTSSDEIKFVLGTAEDFEWMKQALHDHRLASICPILVSWVQPLTPEQQEGSLKKVPEGQTPLTRTQLAERVIQDALPVRFQIQMHKIIWPAAQRGV